MRLMLPWLVALAPAVAAFSFPQLTARDLVSRQDAPKSETPNQDAPQNTTFGEIVVEQATYEEKFGTKDTQLAFAIVVDPRNGDIRFRMAGPNMYSWVAFGTGTQMAGSLMFVMYRGSKKDTTVLSPRIGTDEVEPSYSKTINMTSIQQVLHDHPNGVGDNGMFYQTGLCKGCANLTKNAIDTASKKQQFIYAVGPRGRDSYSDALDAPLRRHLYHGSFALDISRALGVGVPTFKFNTTDKEDFEKRLTLDPDFAESAHAFAMLLTFVIVIPLGIFFIRTLERVKLHMAMQTIALILILVGFATGIVISQLYNRSMKFGSAHQVIGIIIFVLVLAQWASGFISHRQFAKTGSPMKLPMQAHKLVLGPLVFALGIVNASLGFRLALANKLNYLYLPVMFVVIILMFLTSWKSNWFKSRWGSKGNPTSPYNGGAYGQQTTGVAPGYGPPGHEMPYQHSGAYATRSDIALTPMDAPPAYDSTPQKPREFA